jgi:hypothetical protein
MSSWTTVATLPKCDIPGCSKDAYVDGKTKMGAWANMCRGHFDQYGVGLGTGRGQILKTSEEMEKQSEKID